MPMVMAVKLPRVHQVMPNAIETAGNSRDRRKKSKPEPNSKNSVFLSQSLPGGDFITVSAAYASAKPKLNQTTEQRNCHNAQACDS